MQALPQTGYTSYVFLAVLAITVYVLLMRVQRHYARPSRGRPSLGPPRNEPGEHAHSQAAPPAMAQWEVQMHEIARELSARLDSKMAALEQLIREADRAAARLEAAAERQIGRVSNSSPPPEDALPRSDEASGPPPVSQAEALRSTGAGDAKSHLGSHGDDAASARPPADRRYEEIYTLADYGLAPAEIAHRVGSPVGEVELILSLRGKR